jgi:uncharacterized OsmC-like protein
LYKKLKKTSFNLIIESDLQKKLIKKIKQFSKEVNCLVSKELSSVSNGNIKSELEKEDLNAGAKELKGSLS